MALIEFEHVSKTFSHTGGAKLLGAHLRERLRPQKRDVFYALKNVSFRVEPGHSMAIIGGNGAGKSTLLSLVAGLSQPNAGRVKVNGKVAALLELGSGFHPDLTGRENVTLNASLLGLSRKRAEECFGAIVEFSGIGDFIEEPIRTYSSGMIMRLAFSVAVHMDPDILIIVFRPSALRKSRGSGTPARPCCSYRTFRKWSGSSATRRYGCIMARP